MKLRRVLIPIFLLVAVSLTGKVLNIEFSADSVVFTDGICEIEGFSKLRIPGTPILPAKSRLIALPPGSRINSINMEYNSPEILGRNDVNLCPPYLPASFHSEIKNRMIEKWKKNRELIKSSGTLFPASPLFYSKISYFRNIPFIRIIYYPLIYSPSTYYFYPSAGLTINYSRNSADGEIPEWMEERASAVFSNWEEMKDYYRTYTRDDSFDYVILTKDSLFSAFDSLTNWKNSIGFSVKLMSIDSVIDQYPGVDAPDRVRNFLIDKYSSWGIHYLLIGGNVDMIPMKICYPDPEHNPDYNTPTDYYFAELTDDWDSDNDGYCGEYEEDSIGFVPELTVGRFPYNDGTTLRSIAEKTVNFEMDTGNWKNRALLLGAFSNFENEDSTGWPECDGGALMEVMKDNLLSGWQYTRMYEEEGLCPSSYPHEIAITHTNVVDEWSVGNYSVVNWSGHGSPEGAYRKWWAWDNGDSIPDGSEMEWASFIYITDAQSLDDEHPSIVFCESCSNAGGNENLARALIGNGAIGTVAATTYGWYIPGWTQPDDGGCMSLDYYFFHYLIGGGEKTGDALFDSKMYYFTNLYFPDPWAGDPEWTPQQNMLDFTLFGDPSLVREGVGISERPVEDNRISSIRISPNPASSKVIIEYSISFSGDVEIGLFNVAGQKVLSMGKGKQRAGLYKAQFNTQNLSSGVYFINIVIEGKDDKMTAKEKVILF
jgi:hypothetical protein